MIETPPQRLAAASARHSSQLPTQRSWRHHWIPAEVPDDSAHQTAGAVVSPPPPQSRTRTRCFQLCWGCWWSPFSCGAHSFAWNPPGNTRSSGQPNGARSARTKYAYTAALPSRSSHWPPSEESTLSLALCTPNLLDSTLVMAGTVDTAGSSFPRKSPPTICTHRTTLNHVRFPRLA